MSATIDIAALKSVLDPHVVTLKEYVTLGNTPFRLNAFNGVYAPAKTGKTHFVLDELNSLDPTVYPVIWLDGDRNAELKDKFPNIHHFPLKNTAEAFDDLLNQKKNYDNYIFIIDSFKDFTFGKDTDSNKGSQEVFERYQQLLNKGATLVIIFHATKTYSEGKSNDFKMKGNADTIESKMDFLYKFHRTKEMVTLTVVCAREAGINIGDTMIFGNKDHVIKLIVDTVHAESGISLRDLKKKSGLSQFESLIDELIGVVFEIVEVKPEGGGRPKSTVSLINEFRQSGETLDDKTINT